MVEQVVKLKDKIKFLHLKEENNHQKVLGQTQWTKMYTLWKKTQKIMVISKKCIESKIMVHLTKDKFHMTTRRILFRSTLILILIERCIWMK